MTLRIDYGLRMQPSQLHILFSAHASPDVGHERDTSVTAISWLVAVDSTAVVARAVHHAIRLMSCGTTTPLRIGRQCRPLSSESAVMVLLMRIWVRMRANSLPMMHVVLLVLVLVLLMVVVVLRLSMYLVRR